MGSGPTPHPGLREASGAETEGVESATDFESVPLSVAPHPIRPDGRLLGVAPYVRTDVRSPKGAASLRLRL